MHEITSRLIIHLDARLLIIEHHLEALSVSLNKDGSEKIAIRIKCEIDKWLHVYWELKSIAKIHGITLRELKQIQYVNNQITNQGSDSPLQQD